MSDDQLVYSPQMIRERADVLARVRGTWKGRPDYGRTIEMEEWCLRAAASLLEAALAIFDHQAFVQGIEFTPTERLEMAKKIANGVADSELLRSVLTAGETAN